MNYIQIEPVTISKYPVEVIATYCAVPQLTVNTGSTAYGDVILYSELNGEYTQVLVQASAMTDEQYAEWGTDDNYAVNTLISNTNLTRV